MQLLIAYSLAIGTIFFSFPKVEAEISDLIYDDPRLLLE